MSWAVGYDNKWQRDIGYGVPAFCDEPGCNEVIDRGLAYVCNNSEPYGGENGCGLYFCDIHHPITCMHDGYTAKPDHPLWIKHKLADPSWAEWRKDNPRWVTENALAL
jgi:hypothetical protein